MTNSKSDPDAATIARWRADGDRAREGLVKQLTDRGVDLVGLSWLPPDSAQSIVQTWLGMGAQWYGGLSLVAPPGAEVRRGDFRNGDIPPWLDTSDRIVFILFFHDFRQLFLARCDFSFVLRNLSALARADGDGFAALTERLEAVLLVNVEERLGASALELDAWGEFIRRAK